jgi:hypothetical protein
LFLGWSGIRSAVSLLVLNRAQPAMDLPVFARPSWSKLFVGIQLVLGLLLAATSLHTVHKQTAQAQSSLVALPFAGFWTVDEFIVDGTPSKSSSDIPHWTQFVVDSPYVVLLQGTGGFRRLYQWTTDADEKSLTLFRVDNGSDVILNIDRPLPGQLILRGPWHGHTIEVHLHRAEMPKSLLLTRGFHWVNEFPFNR